MQLFFFKPSLFVSALVLLSACSIESGKKSAERCQQDLPSTTGGSSGLPSQKPMGGSGGETSGVDSTGGEAASGGVAATGGHDSVDVLVPKIPVVITEVNRGSRAYVELLNTSAEQVGLSGVELSWGLAPDATTLGCSLGEVSIAADGFLILHDGEECPWSASPCVTGCPVKPAIRRDWDGGSDSVYLTIAANKLIQCGCHPRSSGPFSGKHGRSFRTGRSGLA